jgi:DNA-binding response OmpR family regulator
MPVCSGLEILAALRAAHCAIPVILMTAFGDERTKGEAKRLGASILDKPFTLDALRSAVSTVLGATEPTRR